MPVVKGVMIALFTPFRRRKPDRLPVVKTMVKAKGAANSSEATTPFNSKRLRKVSIIL